MLQAGDVDNPVVLSAVAEAEARWPDVAFAAMRVGGMYRLVASRSGQWGEQLFRASVLTRRDAVDCLRHYCLVLAVTVGAEGQERGPP